QRPALNGRLASQRKPCANDVTPETRRPMIHAAETATPAAIRLTAFAGSLANLPNNWPSELAPDCSRAKLLAAAAAMRDAIGRHAVFASSASRGTALLADLAASAIGSSSPAILATRSAPPTGERRRRERLTMREWRNQSRDRSPGACRMK